MGLPLRANTGTWRSRHECLMPHTFLRNGQSDLFGGADPLVRGRRPRRPAHALQGADIVVPAPGRGRPARTRGSAPPLPPDLQLWQKGWGIRLQPASRLSNYLGGGRVEEGAALPSIGS